MLKVFMVIESDKIFLGWPTASVWSRSSLWRSFTVSSNNDVVETYSEMCWASVLNLRGCLQKNVLSYVCCLSWIYCYFLYCRNIMTMCKLFGMIRVLRNATEDLMSSNLLIVQSSKYLLIYIFLFFYFSIPVELSFFIFDNVTNFNFR
jgi:hypothetical protein